MSWGYLLGKREVVREYLVGICWVPGEYLAVGGTWGISAGYFKVFGGCLGGVWGVCLGSIWEVYEDAWVSGGHLGSI